MGKEFKNKIDFCADVEIPFPVTDFVFVDSETFPTPVFIMVGPVPIFFGEYHCMKMKLCIMFFSLMLHRWTSVYIKMRFSFHYQQIFFIWIISMFIILFENISGHSSETRDKKFTWRSEVYDFFTIKERLHILWTDAYYLQVIVYFNFQLCRVWSCSICRFKDRSRTMYFEFQSKSKLRWI